MDKCPVCSGEPGVKMRGYVLVEALDTINGARQDVYGSPEDSFALIADYWNVFLGSRLENNDPGEGGITAYDVAMMMVLFKIAREENQHKDDNLVDAAGYIGLAADIIG